MRVCHLIDHLDAGGAQRVVADLVTMRSGGVEASVISLRTPRRSETSSVLRATGVEPIGLGLTKRDLTGPVTVRRAVQRSRADILHAHLDVSNSVGVAMALSLGERAPRIVAHLHADPGIHNGRMFRWTARLLASRISAHVAPSRTMVRSIRDVLGDGARRVVPIENGIDLSRFTPTAVDRESPTPFRAGANRVVGFAGRLARQKCVDRLLRALPALLTIERSTRLLIVGDGPERGSLERLAEELGVADAVHFAGHLEDPRAALLAMDVLVLPSAYESFGLVLAEAMSLGVPVVGTAVIGIVDVIDDGETGLLVEPEDPDALVRAVASLFEEIPLRDRLRDAAREAAWRRFDRARMAREVEGVYEMALRDSRRTRTQPDAKP